MRRNILARMLVAAATLIGANAALSDAAENGQAMLVLDASGSMWGQIDGENKIVIARRVVRELVAGWDARVSLGLSAYGHRRKGDCGDIESLALPGEVSFAAIPEIVDGLNPRGKTPLSEAVARAAEAIGFREAPATVILVTDGQETCGADPCAIGERLEAAGADFTAHVVGFDLKTEDTGALRCLAESTGGVFLPAADGKELSEALKSVSRETRAGPDTIRLRLAGEDGFVTGEIRWRVYPADDGGAPATDEPLIEVFSAAPFLDLPPGAYVAEGAAGYAAGRKLLTIAPDRAVEHVLTLDAGRLSMGAILNAGAQEQTRQLRWWAYPVSQAGEVVEDALVETFGARLETILPSGRYALWGRLDQTLAKQDIVIRSGEITAGLLDLKAGAVSLSAVAAPGAPAFTRDVRWRLFRLDASGAREAKAVVDTIAGAPRFTLSEGRYAVTATLGAAEAADEIGIRAGEDQTYVVTLNSGAVRLVPHEGGAESDAEVYWIVQAQAPGGGFEPGYAAYGLGRGPYWFVLNAGRYRFGVRGGDASRLVTVQAGDRKNVVINLDGGAQ